MPGVYFSTSEFLHDAESAAKDGGMPGIRIVTLPADQYYRARSSKEEAQPLAVGCFDSMIDALTRPLAGEEANPSPIQKQREDAEVHISGEDFLGAFEKCNELFLANRWADGLPVVPPTRRLVNAMLSGTTRSAQEVVGQVAPKNGTATVEKIAINAVMAGAKPEYFPVILAAMEGFTDEHYDLTHVQASTGSFTPVVTVGGPIAEELGFNSGIGMLGHGWRPNSTVGRALRLSLLNIGQTWPQVNDMALTGRFQAYTFFTFAEDTTRSPWEPYHVSRGFQPEDSTVTVATSVTAPAVFGGGAVMPWTGQGVVESMIGRVKSGGVVWPHAQTFILVLHPDCAIDLAKRGYTRRSLQEYLYEQSRVPYEKVAGPVFFGRDDEIDFIRTSITDGRIRSERAPVFLEALKPGGRIPVVQGPDDFHIVVAGGSPGYDLLFSYPGTNWANQTKRISGATLTHAGRD